MEFSNTTARLLKVSFPNELSWSTENTLDLTCIKKLKGCRIALVQNCLEIIQKLDRIAETECDERIYPSLKIKDLSVKIKDLIEKLQQYKISCERYPRFKDFLNIIPDNVSVIVGIIIIGSAIASTAFPPLAAFPLFIISWVLMDLFFNNRDQAKNLHTTLSTIQRQLSILQERNLLIQTLRSTRPSSSAGAITSTSTSHSSMFGRVNQPYSPDRNVDSPPNRFTLSL